VQHQKEMMMKEILKEEKKMILNSKNKDQTQAR